MNIYSTFKEFLVNENEAFSDSEIYALYADPYSPIKVKEISLLTGKSIGEIYRAIYQYGIPNRQKTKHHLVQGYANQGVPVKNIAELTGYSERGIRNILKRTTG